MKKSLLILSMLALTATAARAYDTLEPGNYYLIKTMVGTPFLTYSADGVAAGESTTHLTRTDNPDQYALWEVKAGSTDGTIVIKSYSADAYLVKFQTSTGEETTVHDSFANTSTTPIDLYTEKNDDNSYVLKIRSNLYQQIDGEWNYFALNIFNGNIINGWSGDGIKWYFTKVDIEGASSAQDAIDKVLYSVEFEDAQTSAIERLSGYMENVPMVADLLSQPLEEIKAKQFSVGAAAEITTTFSTAVASANERLKTCLDEKVFAVVNLRRDGKKEAVMAINAENTKFSPVSDYNNNPASWFKFVSNKSDENGGYYLVNFYDNMYVGGDNGVTPSSTNPMTVYPILNSNSGYSGVVLSYLDNLSGNGFNMNNNAVNDANESVRPVLTSYMVNDGGSIWKLVDCASVQDTYVKSFETSLTSYAENVKPASKIFTDAISKVQSIDIKSACATQYLKIVSDATGEVNELLKTVFDGKDVTLKSLYTGKYISLTDGAQNFTVGDTPAIFAMSSDEDGGYLIYNKDKNVYFYKNNQEVYYTKNIDEATGYFPQLVATNVGNGVCFPSSANYPTDADGICYNSAWADELFDFTITGGNAPFGVFGVDIIGTTTEIAEVEATAPAADMIYDLSGRRLSAPVRGINIINGRKVLVK